VVGGQAVVFGIAVAAWWAARPATSTAAAPVMGPLCTLLTEPPGADIVLIVTDATGEAREEWLGTTPIAMDQPWWERRVPGTGSMRVYARHPRYRTREIELPISDGACGTRSFTLTELH
jgi:hypothetical protein